MNKRFKSLFSLNPLSITTYLTFFIALVFLIGPSFLERVELETLDLRFVSRGTRVPGGTVVLAVIDEESLDKEGKWPWQRSKIARLVDFLSHDGAKVIAFDIGFLEPDENNNLPFIQELESKIARLQLENKELDRFLDESKALANNDLILANAIKSSKAKVVLGYFFHTRQEDLGYEIDTATINKKTSQISSSKYPILLSQEDAHIDLFISKAYAPEINLQILNQATDSSGYFNMFPDPDGVVRWIPLTIKCGEDIFPPLSIQSVWNYLDRPPLIVKVASYGVEGIQMGDIKIPTRETGEMMINYLGPQNTFPHYPITDILNNKIPEGAFKDKIVMVGATATGIYDMRSTPFQTVYPGLEVHATVIDNILRQQFLTPSTTLTKFFDLLAIILIGVVTGLAVPRLGAAKGALFAAGLFMAYIFLTWHLFAKSGVLLNITYPLIALIALYISLTIYKYMTEERERKKIKGAFTHYVSPSVVNEMLKHPEKLKLGGDRRDLSVLFSDIRGFTTMAEGLTPEDLEHLLNEYLTVMTDIVFKYKGTLDKYMGDAIMAFYGAPVDVPDHPIKACQSALEMIEELKRLNQKWIDEGKQPLDIGIGINTNPMAVGNFGSRILFDYTVLGDSVNLGSRLEGTNKTYKTNIIISEFTFERVKDEFACMELDSVRVKGKTQPVKIYNLLAEKKLPETQERIVNAFTQGLGLYKSKKWDKAMHVFENITTMDPGLYAAQVYIERCLDLKKNPPPADWDGVYVMTTK